jgi:hypothetical protein
MQMRIILAKLLLGISSLGLIFTIYGQRPVTWIILFVIFFLLGSVLISASSKKDLQEIQLSIDKEIEDLKSTGQKIKLDFDSCDFKESSYNSEVIDERVSRFGHLNLDYGKVIGNELVAQSLLIYNHKEGDQIEVFRQGFHCSADALKLYVLKNSIDLYVDRVNRNKYFFELNDTGN